MADIEQSLQDIQQERSRLLTAKANLKTAINGKGGNITDDKLDSYYMYVNEINTGSDVSGVTATPADVRKTVKYVTASGELVSGTMSDSTASVADGKVTVTAGYLSADYVYTIPAVEGTDLSFITAGAGQILSGYVGSDKDGNPVSGTITTKTSDDVTFVGGTVELPPGYYAGVSKSIPVGTTTQNGNTVNISEGWHYDQFVDVGAAYPGGTITPGTEDQIINADSYITSTLTIKGDSNLQAENIASGISIFGVAGTHSGGYDTSDATAIAGFVMDGYTFYGADGKETGTLKALSTSDMGIMEDAVLGIPATRHVDNATYSLLNVAGIGDLSAENIVEGKTIAGIPGSHKCATTEVVAGVLVDDGGTMKVQKLTFDGTTPSDDGDPVTVDSFYTFNTGRDEPVYDSGISGGSTMEIYKCVDAEGLTWWVVSGCGSTEANGRYYQGEEVFDTYNMQFVRPFYQKDGSCSIEYKDGCWKVFSGNTVLYRDEGWSYHDGDPSQCTGWVVESGVEPVPTITKETTTGNGWKGRKYDTETGEVVNTVTELEYKYKVPTIGKFYTADASITCIVYEKPDLVFYAPLHEQKATDETGKLINASGNITYADYQGVKMGYFNGGYLSISDNSLPKGNEPRSISFFAVLTGDVSSNTYPAVVSMGPSSNVMTIYTYTDKRLTVTAKVNRSSVFGVRLTEDITILQHYTVVYTGDTCITYCNGDLVEEGKATSQINTSAEYYIGLNIEGNHTFQGYISEVKVWNGVLRQDTIKAEADRCLAMVETDSGDGGTGDDESGGDGTKLQFTATTGPSSHDGVYVLEDESKTGTDRVWVREGSTDKIFYVGYMVAWVCPMDGGVFYAEGGSDSNPWDVTWDSATVTVIK